MNSTHPQPRSALTPAEREHLVLLGVTAGVPVIMADAVDSGNIFDPAHMERAKAMNRAFEEGVSVLGPYWEQQKARDAEYEKLDQMGMKMGGKPVGTRYAHLEANVKDMGLPQPGWFLRIEADGDHVDMFLTPHADVIHDCLVIASQKVPRFQARLFCPEPVVIFSHGV